MLFRSAHATEYVSENLNHLFIPVMLYENSTNNDRIYQNIFRVTTEYSQVPEANTSFVDQATNSVIMPIIDGETRQVLFWINIQQGMQWGKTRSYVFNQEGATYNYPSTRSTLESTSEDRQNWLYGAAEGHSFGILVPGKETSTTYDIIGDEPLLEGGVGIGSEEEIGEILSSDGSLTDLIKIIKNLNIRMIVLYPFYEIHESSVD